MTHSVRVDNGKYTFTIPEQDGSGPEIRIFRYSEFFLKIGPGFNAVHSMMCELDAARVVLDAARRLGDDAPREIKLALAHHSGLVGDREPPSQWASPFEDKPR